MTTRRRRRRRRHSSRGLRRRHGRRRDDDAPKSTPELAVGIGEGAATARWARPQAARCCRPSRTTAAAAAAARSRLPRPRLFAHRHAHALAPPRRVKFFGRRSLQQARIRSSGGGGAARSPTRDRRSTRTALGRSASRRVEAATTAVPSVAVSSWSERGADAAVGAAAGAAVTGGGDRHLARRRRGAAGARRRRRGTSRFFGVVERHFDFLAVRSRRSALPLPEGELEAQPLGLVVLLAHVLVSGRSPLLARHAHLRAQVDDLGRRQRRGPPSCRPLA